MDHWSLMTSLAYWLATVCVCSLLHHPPVHLVYQSVAHRCDWGSERRETLASSSVVINNAWPLLHRVCVSSFPHHAAVKAAQCSTKWGDNFIIFVTRSQICSWWKPKQELDDTLQSDPLYRVRFMILNLFHLLLLDKLHLTDLMFHKGDSKVVGSCFVLPLRRRVSCRRAPLHLPAEINDAISRERIAQSSPELEELLSRQSDWIRAHSVITGLCFANQLSVEGLLQPLTFLSIWEVLKQVALPSLVPLIGLGLRHQKSSIFFLRVTRNGYEWLIDHMKWFVVFQEY